MALKFLTLQERVYILSAIKCIEYAVANGATILSNSWSGDNSQPHLETPLLQLIQKG
jgi:hypothetical protein